MTKTERLGALEYSRSCDQAHFKAVFTEAQKDPTRSSGPPKRQRQARTVYTKEQLDVLKEYFQKNKYPGYQDRLRLAARLSLEEHKLQEGISEAKGVRCCPGSRSKQGVSGCRPRAGPRVRLNPVPYKPSNPTRPGLTPPLVSPCPDLRASEPADPLGQTPSWPPGPWMWFKNRRAQRSRLERLAKGRSHRARDAPTDPGAPGAPGPAPAPVLAAVAAAAAGPAFPDGPGFRSPPPRSLAGMLPAPEPSISSQGQAMWALAQGAQAPVQAASAPAPPLVWPLDPYAPNFAPDPFPIPDFTVVFSPQDPSPGSPSPLMSGSRKRDECVDENDLDPKRLLSL
ncbi:tetrapeptide repeat homeobox protein 2-like [Eubalaena glacialis]|uniref:tetrapeptide repeat homeobox protein 2-like n=1 Tax=Eubalaena glacialis TaxID=27606 RepID=UPI002A5AEE31|nr:tetrapeptide repeat homeobox protein 2-like [Eubalaena glacialis]